MPSYRELQEEIEAARNKWKTIRDKIINCNHDAISWDFSCDLVYCSDCKYSFTGQELAKMIPTAFVGDKEALQGLFRQAKYNPSVSVSWIKEHYFDPEEPLELKIVKTVSVKEVLDNYKYDEDALPKPMVMSKDILYFNGKI